VIGQVTVSMDALRKDLEHSGIISAQQKGKAEANSSQTVNAPGPAAESVEAQGEEDREPSREAQGPHPAVSQPQAAEGGASRPAFRGISATKGEILWVVRKNGSRSGNFRLRASVIVFCLREVSARKWTAVTFRSTCPWPAP